VQVSVIASEHDPIDKGARHAMRTREVVEPMTLGNMWANGVRRIAVYCNQCHHQAVLDVETWPDHVPVQIVPAVAWSAPMRHRRPRRAARRERAGTMIKPHRCSMAVRRRHPVACQSCATPGSTVRCSCVLHLTLNFTWAHFVQKHASTTPRESALPVG